MAMVCPECVYYNESDSTCRANSPHASLLASGQYSTDWPPVKATDWCAEGYNPTDGFYDKRPDK